MKNRDNEEILYLLLKRKGDLQKNVKSCQARRNGRLRRIKIDQSLVCMTDRFIARRSWQDRWTEDC